MNRRSLDLWPASMKAASFVGLILLSSLCTGWEPHSRPIWNDSCNEPLPKGVKKLGPLRYRGPWVFRQGRGGYQALRSIDNSDGRLKKGRLEIHLDDGSIGALTVERRECRPGEDCGPFDCGCFAGAGDSYWVHVRDATGRRVTDFHLWAAYGNFQIVAADLVGGRGDELLILRQPNRGSPMYRYDLTIFRLGGAKPVELGSLGYVCEWLNCCCSAWRDNIYIEGSGKPHRLVLHREIMADPCCRALGSTDELGRRRVFRFSASRRKYEERS